MQGKQIKALADTDASSSIVALNWVKYLKLEHLITPIEESFLSAQGSKMLVEGTINIPITFGNKEFMWTFRVAKELICPMIIGMDILHEGSINLKKR